VSFVIYVFKNSVAQNPREGAKRLGSAEETHGSEKFFRDASPFPIPRSPFPKNPISTNKIKGLVVVSPGWRNPVAKNFLKFPLDPLVKRHRNSV